MNKYIATEDLICGECGCKLPKGEFVYGEGYCEECYWTELRGEIYG